MIPNSVVSIGDNAFDYCTLLENVTLGSGIENIGKNTFRGCEALTCFSTRTQSPPLCDDDAFFEIDKELCTLYVPAGTLETYKSADQWKEFTHIKEISDANSDGTVSMADANIVVNYFLNTNKKTVNDIDTIAADVNGDGQITMADANLIVNTFLNKQ